jgi:hypothetical protein
VAFSQLNYPPSHELCANLLADQSKYGFSMNGPIFKSYSNLNPAIFFSDGKDRLEINLRADGDDLSF